MLPFSSEISAPALALVLGWSGRPWVASLDKFLREVCGRSSQLAAAAAAPAECGEGETGRERRVRAEERGVQQKILDRGEPGCWRGQAANLRTLNSTGILEYNAT